MFVGDCIEYLDRMKSSLKNVARRCLFLAKTMPKKVLHAALSVSVICAKQRYSVMIGPIPSFSINNQ